MACLRCVGSSAFAEALPRAMPDSELDLHACAREKCVACDVFDALEFVS